MRKSSPASGRGGRSASSDPFTGIDLVQVSDRLRALAHPERLRLVGILLQEELPVGELALRIGVPQPQVSGHLRILQAKGMLTCRRDGHRMHYTVATPALNDICTCIRTHFGSCKVGGA